MSKILFGDKYSKLEEDDLAFISELDDHLSYKVEGSEFSMAATRGFWNGKNFVVWDGRQKILTEKLSFPSGLLDRVKKFYANHNKQVTIVDVRKPKSQGLPVDLYPRLNEIGMIPYPYQEEAVDKALEYDRGILKLATGAGKTLVSGMLAAKIGKKTLVMVIGLDLLNQFHETYTKIFNKPIGRIGDGICDIQDITIATIWSLGTALGLKNKELSIEEIEQKEKNVGTSDKAKILKFMKEAKVAFLDESHVAGCNTINKIYKYIEPEHLYGFSGTPFKLQESDIMIEGVLGDYICDVSSSFLIDNGFLARPLIKFISVPKMEGLSGANYQTVYKEYVVDNEVRNNLIVNNAIELVKKGYQVLVLFKSIRHGKTLFDMLKDKARVEIMDGSDDSEHRNNVKEKAMKKELDVIVCSTIRRHRS